MPCRVNHHPTLRGGILSTSGFDWWESDLVTKAHASGVRLRTWGDGYGYLLVASGRIRAEGVFTHTFPLSRGADAFALFDERKDTVMKVRIDVRGERGA